MFFSEFAWPIIEKHQYKDKIKLLVHSECNEKSFNIGRCKYGIAKIMSNITIRFTLKGAHCILAKAHTDIQVLNKALLVPEG